MTFIQSHRTKNNKYNLKTNILNNKYNKYNKNIKLAVYIYIIFV